MQTHPRRTDDGFTLVEVIVALALMSIVATAALYFFVGGQRAVVQQTRTQAAVTVANDAMEVAYAVPPLEVQSGAHRVSGLVAGRAQSVVQTAWTAAAGVEGLDVTYPAWDPAASPSTTPAVPLRSSSELNGVEYETLTLIGTCYRLARSVAQEDCGRLPGHASDPGAAPNGYVKHMRVIVRVSWQDIASACGASGCGYTITSLLDPNDDAVWNNTTRPVAMDDVAVVEVGRHVDIPVVLNDSIGRVVADPIEIVALPPAGQGTAVRAGDGRSIRFTAPAAWSGPVELTYRLRDQAGRLSNVATVRVSVTGIAVDDAASGVRNRPFPIPVTANDKGVATRVQITSPPTGASAVAAGTDVQFNAPNPGTYVFEYKFWSTDTIESTVARVTVTIANHPPGLTPDLDIAIPASMASGPYDFDMTGRTGNEAGYVYVIESVQWANGEKLLVNGTDFRSGSNRAGTQLGFWQQGNTLGGAVFTYRVRDPDGVLSTTTGTARAVVVPQAVDDTFSVQGGRTHHLHVGQNDVPSNFGGTVTFTPAAVGSPTCGSLTQNAGDARNGILRYNAPSRQWWQPAVTCTFTYSFTGAPPYQHLTSNVATVSVRVSP